MPIYTGPVTKFYGSFSSLGKAEIDPLRAIKLWSRWNIDINKWANELIKYYKQK